MTIELRAVAKTVGGAPHIHPTDLALAAEGFNVLLGATGAGKTTLMKIMAGLDRPTSGRVWMDGRDVTDVSPQRRGVSFVHQFFINYPNMTVWENIASPLRVAGIPAAEIAARVDRAAELLRLGPFLKRRPAELSGGQQQRTAIARAIVKDARLVLLDEPLANLDYKLREELRDQLPALFAGRGATVVYATSEPSEALMLGGHTATLHEGRITQFGPTAEVYRSPADAASAGVFSDPPINLAPVVKRDGRVALDGAGSWPAAGAAAALADGSYLFGIRPHFVSPIAGRGVAITGRVAVTELSGSESTAHFAFGPHVWVSQAPGVHPYKVGEAHVFHAEVAAGFYFDGAGRRVA
jgi:glycerol transport system ATP-binding protein